MINELSQVLLVDRKNVSTATSVYLFVLPSIVMMEVAILLLLTMICVWPVVLV
ncbi:MAG TPA: hypothetical protein PK252_06720 [Bacteroidales bacterium]|nr:hypothetical protein [Bacteroidales bacterium]